jgi:hypothetical protein
MRVLLRDLDTGLYFRDSEKWTSETEEAQTFRHSAEAMDHARAQGMQNAEVVLAFEESRFAVSLPLPKST